MYRPLPDGRIAADFLLEPIELAEARKMWRWMLANNCARVAATLREAIDQAEALMHGRTT